MTLTERKTSWTADEQREHRKIWVKALRSGKYQQVRGALHKVDGFCCLGVACDVSDLGDWKIEGEHFLFRGGEETMLPADVREWLGLSGRLGGYSGKIGYGGKKRIYLADLNDDGTSFAKIADIIGSEPAGLLADPESAS